MDSNYIEAQEQTGQTPSPLWQCHLTQRKEQIKNTGPCAPWSPSCFSGCHKTNSHWVRLVSATRSPSSHQLLYGALDGGMGALPSGMQGTAVSSVLRHLTQLQLPTAEWGKNKLSCNLWQQSFCWIQTNCPPLAVIGAHSPMQTKPVFVLKGEATIATRGK